MGNDNTENKEGAPKKLVIFTRTEKWIYGILAVFALLWIISSPLIHIYGPYKGKVVDLETGAPIEGAAVFVEFITEGIYSSSDYGSATETMTDVNGEFSILWRPVLSLRPAAKWKPNGYVTIFKPGYGAYPLHPKAKPRFKVGGTIPEKEYVTILLPKLGSVEERKKNLRNISISGDVPKRKYRKLSELEEEEDRFVWHQR